MAFRGETSAVGTLDVQVVSSDAGAVITAHNQVAAVDAFRVRLAIGFMILVALVDCVLYLPRSF